MVQTRRQYRDWVNTRGPDYSSQQCEQCSQENNNNNNNENDVFDDYFYGDRDDDEDDPEPEVPRRGPQYRVNDACKRHRQQDDEPYGVDVIAYKRRKPIR